jgi:hypothetical protein
MAEAKGMYSNETFRIHGFRLAVTAEEPWLRDGVREALQAFRAPVEQADAAMVLMAGRTDGVPPTARPGAVSASARGPAEFRFGEMQCYRAAHRLVYSDGRSTIIVDPPRARAEGTVCRGEAEAPGTPWRAWQQPVFTFSLLELLRHHGLYHLHAAAVERRGAGLLITGDTGAGKSTLTVLLARAGWGFLSDDAVLLRLAAGGVEARALPTPFHVDPALSASLPELAALGAAAPYNGGPKRELDPEQLYGREFRPTVEPRVLLFPRVHRRAVPPPAQQVGPGIWLRQVSPGQAVAELIRASALVLLDERAAAGHLESLRRLALSCAGFRLYHGPEALEAPDEFAQVMEDLTGAYAERTGAEEDRCAVSTRSGSS